MKRYGYLLALFTGASLSAQLAYRANFVLYTLEMVFRAAGVVFGLFILYADGVGIGGWSFHQALVVVGIYTLMEGVGEVFMYPNLRNLAEGVRTGSLDFHLLKPIDSQFLVSVRSVNVFYVAEIVLGIGIIAYALWHLPHITLGNVILGSVLLLCGMIITYCIWVSLASTAFWFTKVENVLELFWGFYSAAQFPVQAFSGWVRAFFTFFVPVAFITTVPAEAFIGTVTAQYVVLALAVTGILMLLARVIWLLALRNYSSASS